MGPCASKLRLSSFVFSERLNVFDLNYIRIIRFELNSIAQWPNGAYEPLTPWTRLLTRYHYVMYIISCSFGIICTLYIKDHLRTQSFIESGHDYLNVLMTIMMLQRMTLAFCSNYRDLVKRFVLEFHLHLHQGKNDFAAKECRRINKICRIACAIILSQLGGALSLYMFVPLFQNYHAGMFSDNRPENGTFAHAVNYNIFNLQHYTDTSDYILVFFINLYPGYNVATTMCCVDLLIFTIVFHISGHLNILVHELRNFPRPKNSAKMNTVAGRREYNEEVNVALKDVIEYDNWIKDFIKRTSDTFGITLLFYLAFHQVTGCVLLLECSEMTAEAIGSYGILTLTIFQQLIQTSVIFEIISTKCSVLPDEVYALPWELMDVNNRKRILFFLKNVQISRALKACGVLPIGVVTMTAIIKTTCSYFLMLKAFT